MGKKIKLVKVTQEMEVDGVALKTGDRIALTDMPSPAKPSPVMPLVKVKGALRLYARKPGCGQRRFVVRHADGRILEEFRRQKPAVLWMKGQAESKVPKTLPDGEICDDCQMVLPESDPGLSCPDGSFICRGCFNDGAH